MLEPHPEADVAARAERQPLLSDPPFDDPPKSILLDEANSPREKVLLRVSAAMLSFFVMGTHTAAIAVLIDYVEPFYSINDTMVSLLFVTPVSGYLIASLSNSSIHARFGRRGVATIGALCSLLITVVAACGQYPVF